MGLAIGFVVFLLLMFAYIRFLQWQADNSDQRLVKNRQALTQLQADLKTAKNAYNDAEEQRQLLESSITRKTEELSAASNRLDDLEDKLGGNIGAAADGGTLVKRLDLASIAMGTREVTLNLLPNGHPVNYEYISSPFGMRMHPIRGRELFHAGDDLAVNIGTPVHATADGVVEIVSHRRTGYGNMLLLAHAFGFKTRYGHLSKIVVKRGQYVHKGDLIAYSGNSGSSTGPHLHYEVTYAGIPLNPKPFLNWRLNNYAKLFDLENKVPWPSLLATIENLRTLWQPPLSQQAHSSVAKSNSPATFTSMEKLMGKSKPTTPFVSAGTAK
ncbi:M23 family metallopeptidase [Gallaecimonas mangrovi]|uniref:M23 family metallopeptidase n=1 Tax=Gallaecimonas mangrovi TaxID=2291597 RepID=UPI001868F395|nr:M23 family metallopeptidase [Gallaecimonas mangrovi]